MSKRLYYTKKEKWIAKQMKITPAQLRVYENITRHNTSKKEKTWPKSGVTLDKAVKVLVRKGYITKKKK